MKRSQRPPWPRSRCRVRSTVAAATAALLLLGPRYATVAAGMDPSAISEHTLSNGMEVLLWEDHAIPNLAIYTFWKVGSRNEDVGNTGLAHFFEHMMFNGSRNYPPGEFDRTMEAAGGSNNAYTSNDVTVYQDWIPAAALDITLELEADRIGHLSVDPDVVESERGVVMSERRRSIEDDNHSLMWEQLNSLAFMAHPYSWPILGWRSDIESWRQEDVRGFFERWYTPNNAVLVVCGAFDEEAILAKLERNLGSLPTREIPRGVVTEEPEQRGERRGVLRKEANLSSVLVAWHVPETFHEDMRVLELVDLLLSQGESSRLYRRLVDEDQLALWVWTGTGRNFDPGLFEILVQNREDIDGPTVEQALYEEIDRLAAEPVDERELTKAKNMLIAEFYRDMATLSGRAEALGSHELFHGDWRRLFDVVQTYENIRPEDIQRVASTYFTPDNRTVVTLIPATEQGGSEDAR